MPGAMSRLHWWITAGVWGGIVATASVAVLALHLRAERGVFDYRNKAEEKHYDAIKRYCDPILDAFINGQLASDSGNPGDQDKPSEKQYELCQQWRSAEAAIKSAAWSVNQSIIALISMVIAFLTLVAASAAAYFAKGAVDAGSEAAKHAEDGAAAAWATVCEAKKSYATALASAKETSRIAEFEFRSLLHVSHAATVIRNDLEPLVMNDDGFGFTGGPRKMFEGVVIVIDNIGRIPARDIAIKVVLGLSEGLMPPTIFAEDTKLVDLVMPNSKSDKIGFPLDHMRQKVSENFPGRSMPELFATLEIGLKYDDEITAERGATAFRTAGFTFEGKVGHAMRRLRTQSITTQTQTNT